MNSVNALCFRFSDKVCEEHVKLMCHLLSNVVGVWIHDHYRIIACSYSCESGEPSRRLKVKGEDAPK